MKREAENCPHCLLPGILPETSFLGSWRGTREGWMPAVEGEGVFPSFCSTWNCSCIVMIPADDRIPAVDCSSWAGTSQLWPASASPSRPEPCVGMHTSPPSLLLLQPQGHKGLQRVRPLQTFFLCSLRIRQQQLGSAIHLSHKYLLKSYETPGNPHKVP